MCRLCEATTASCVVSLPAASASKRGVVTPSPASATSSTATATTKPTATAAATTEASHLGESWINLLVGLFQYLDELACLLRVCKR